MTDNRLRFHNGKFKIMQISDTQDLRSSSPDTVRLIRMAVAAEKPDLVIFTGDQIYGIHPKLWTRDAVARIIDSILTPVAEYEAPFAVTFGNHDDECGISGPEQIGTLYSRYPAYTPGDRRADDDPGTFRIPICGADGKPLFDVFAFDTHGSKVSATPSGVTAAQLEWFEKIRGEERAETGDAPPALVFQHIAVPEFYRVIRQVPKGTKDSVEAFGKRSHTFYALPDDIKAAGGFMKEAPSISGDAEFETLKKDGGVLAVAVGHDHNNSFVARYDGIDLIYTQGAGFHTYGPRLKRGVRVFVLDEEDPASYETYTRTWENLTNERPSQPVKEFIISNTPSSIAQAKAWAKRSLPFTAAAGIGLAVLRAAIKKKP
ncbi:MAG: metallophosphoesterase family protein [Clostridia bacterium]|nr:metallophosphoesterase family protein [Clostridia bacterium]